MSHYQFKKQHTDGPNGTTVTFINTDENEIIEIGTVNEITYAYVPTGLDIPLQPEEIDWQPATITSKIREDLKKVSPLLKLIKIRTEDRVRSKYSQEEENYFSRIGVGCALGKYQFLPGEEAELEEFGMWIEDCRQWGISERAKLGL